MKKFKEGDRVILYHISGCGVCNDCRRGYMISCTSTMRAAYGWQRDGGMAEYILADEKDCVFLPDELSYVITSYSIHYTKLYDERRGL